MGAGKIVCNIVQHCVLIECMPGMHETLSLIPISIPLKNLMMMDSFKEGWDSRRNNYFGLHITYLYYAWLKNHFSESSFSNSSKLAEATWVILHSIWEVKLKIRHVLSMLRDGWGGSRGCLSSGMLLSFLHFVCPALRHIVPSAAARCPWS